MEYVTLNTGVKMPMLGFGVFQIPNKDTKRCVLEAIEAGYRLIDTASTYGNEKEVGEAIAACGVPREELFIIGKVWVTDTGYERAKASVESTLKNLQTDYVDAMLVHQPFGDYYGTYRALEEAYKEGKTRTIGVSNFTEDRLADICAFNEVQPDLNQVELHVFHQQKSLREAMDRYHSQIMACSPLAQGENGMFTNETLTEIGKKYGKSAAQTALRFLIQSGVVLVVKSTHKNRMLENLQLFDFKLKEDELKKIKALDLNKSLFLDYSKAWTAEVFSQQANVKEKAWFEARGVK